jgi:hypothetical protein
MTLIHLCPAAWSLYFRRRWKALDRHRQTCNECWRKVVD